MQTKPLVAATVRKRSPETGRLKATPNGKPRTRGRQKEKGPLTSLIGIGRGTYGTVEQIDEYIRAERDAWDE